MTTISSSSFCGDGLLAPEPAKISRIALIGPYARRAWIEDRDTFDHSDYEFWIVANRPLFPDTALWESTEALIDHEVGSRCAVSLSVYSTQDIRTARATADTFILDHLEAGITLHRARRDAPLGHRERALWRGLAARRGR